MTSMEKGTIKLTVKFPNQQIKDQKVILCASQDASKSTEPCSDSSESTKQQDNVDEQLMGASDLSMNDPAQNQEEINKKEEPSESTNSPNSEKNITPNCEEPLPSTSSQTPKKKEKVNFSWDAKTFTNLSEQHIQHLNEYQRLWIQQAYQNYLGMHMLYYSTLGLGLRNNVPYPQPQNFIPNYNAGSSNMFRDIRNDQQAAVDSQQNGTVNQENQSINNNNNNVNNNNNNNNNNNQVDDNAENLDNRDWLDNFYMLSRIVILFSIVYFYSSPLRFLIVTLLGFMIFLYHHGYFRNHQIMLPNNENVAAANVENNDQIQEEENQAPVVQQPPQNRPLIERETTNGTDRDNDNNEERPGVVALAWIFLSSFFASLIPD